MNPHVLTLIMKIRALCDELPPQGLSEARRAGSIFEFSVTDPPQGRPFGGGGIHPTRRIEMINHGSPE